MDTAVLQFVTLMLILLTPHVTLGFVPNDLARFGLNAVSLSFDSFETHEDMTRNAILAVAADVLRDNPNPMNEDSTRRIDALSSLDESSLLTAYFGERIRTRINEFEDAIEMIAEANTDVDFDEAEDAAAHFDSEQFQSGQNRLVELRQMVVSEIILSNRLYDIARRETGRMFHTLQDFYSHSNWIETGNLVPYSVLGDPDRRPENIAPPNMPTCVDCEEDRRFLRVADFFGITESSTVYACIDNLVSSLKQNRILTSGYIGEDVEKPSGKCSHGGFRDSTTDSHATGGINKDSPNDVWSPHHYLFDEAMAVAQQATIDILQAMREDVNDDQKFGEYLGITVNQVTSIAYVVDTSVSMEEELPEIQATIPILRRELSSAFANDMHLRYILVPFNEPDPGLIFETQDINEFSAEIGELVAVGGGVSGKPTIGALIRAIEASNIGSSVYVFTDDVPSDGVRLNEALALIIEKKVTVTFVVANMMMVRKRFSIIHKALQFQNEHHRNRRKLSGTDIYERIAIFSGGQLLNINTDDISETGTLISFSALQTRNTILSVTGVSLDEQRFTFPVDGSVKEIVISISGEDIVTALFSPQGINAPEYSSVLNSSGTFIASINITDNTLRGEWEISLQSRGAFSIQVLGNSELTFSARIFGSSNTDTRSFQFRQIIGKPYEGQKVIVLFQVEGGPATPTTLNLIDVNGMIAHSLNNLTRLQDGKYFVQFNLPSGSFKLQLVGMDGAGFTFSHISETSIESTTLSLTLSEANTRIVTLRPGENSTVTMIMNNRGATSEFQLTVNTVVIGSQTDFFEYKLDPETVILGQGQQTEVTIDIDLFSNATDGLGVTFTVIAVSLANENVNEFITFDVVTTTIPPPMFTDNDFSGTISSLIRGGSLILMEMILAITALGIMYY